MHCDIIRVIIIAGIGVIVINHLIEEPTASCGAAVSIFRVDAANDALEPRCGREHEH